MNDLLLRVFLASVSLSLSEFLNINFEIQLINVYSRYSSHAIAS
jgi:hypothetical protein